MVGLLFSPDDEWLACWERTYQSLEELAELAAKRSSFANLKNEKEND